DGGTDAGCSSGELLLLAVGSCAAGSVRNHLESCGVSTEGLSVDVDFRPSVTGGEHDAIAITLWLPGEVSGTDGDTIKRAAVSGGVVSRLLLGSEIQVECRSRQTAVGAR
ncbi:MAG TPA: OsmC family protein, partial [Xanthobacteraceae bacterium]|nr:OsmC family protein [Xanthobacteraceae bacterium]